MDAPSSKATPAPQHLLLILVAHKATSAMPHVSRRATPKKQQLSSTAECLLELSEIDDEDGLMIWKHPQLVNSKSTH